MLFSNLLFVLLFLPVFLIAYHFVAALSGKNVERENTALLIFSLFFYAFGGLKGLIVLLVVTVIAYIGGRMMIHAEESARKVPLILTVSLLVLILAFFKYAGFFISISMPIGLSFYIFQLLSYVADVYTGKIEEEISFKNLLIYTACFHHVLQGPILRYNDIGEALRKRNYNSTTLSNGIFRFCTGLFKKVLLADHAGELANSLLPNAADISSVPTLSVWLGSICFSLQMFIDFSSYSDMAIGLGEMIGFKYPENFDYPYISKSIREFWRRWHISLSFFFRDYVYIPLGGNRKGKGRKILNLLIVWLLTGIWHGSTVNFIVWGLFYFVFLCIEDLWREHVKFDLPAVIKHIYVIFVFNLGWLIFRFENTSYLLTALKTFFGMGENGFTMQTVTLMAKNNIFFFIVAILVCTPVFKKITDTLDQRAKERKVKKRTVSFVKMLISVVALILSIIIMAGSSYQPFLYNQF